MRPRRRWGFKRFVKMHYSRDMGQRESIRARGSVAEHLFESYLASQELRWEYEPLLGGKRPDYLIQHSGGGFVVEVEELQRPDPTPTDRYSPTTAVREALRRARIQLRGCRHLPTGIV